MRSTALLTLTALLLASGALAEPAAISMPLYRYVDERGVVHFTNLPSDRRFARVARTQAATWASRTHRSRPARRSQAYDAVIVSASRKNGLPPALVKAVVAAESAFDASAVSPKGAMGLMQLMPATARSLGVDEPFRAEQNVHAGARYLRSLHDRFGEWTHALAAYNAGPTAVRRYQGVPPYPETQQYVKRVLSYYRRFHGDFPR